jgi:hypothetical protein
MDEQEEKRRAHVIQLLKIMAFSGWVLAISSLFMGSYFLNKFHLEIVEMQRENKELKLSLERARTNHELIEKTKTHLAPK